MRPIYTVFSENLNYYMQDREISQTQLAVAMDVSMSIVSEWMNGKKAPRFGNLEKLCNYLGISYTQLLADREIETNVLNTKEEHLLMAYKRITDTGKNKLLVYADDMTQIHDKEKNN